MAGRRNTRQRELVLQTVRSLRNHPTANQIYECVHAQDEHVSLGTVYRNLNLLAESGEILSIQTAAGNHYDFNVSDHSHVVCTSCGAMVDAFDASHSALDARAEEVSGYKISGHYLVFEGVCPACQVKAARENIEGEGD